MEILISKELLSEVLEINNINLILANENEINYTQYASMSRGTIDNYINIYELSHKCKEWALNKGHRLLSGFDEEEYENSPDIEYSDIEYSCIVNHIYCEGGCRSDNNFNSYSEPEAIFKACQWILDNMKSDFILISNEDEAKYCILKYGNEIAKRNLPKKYLYLIKESK